MRWARDVGGLTVCSELVNPGLGRVAGADARRTASFTWSARRALLVHRLPDARIDNDLGDLVAAELVRPGLLDDFEAAFAGVVTSTAADPLDAWERFYAQTLAGLAGSAGGARLGGGAIATFGAIYDHALSLVIGDSLLDAGSCFGFFCLLAAARRPGLRVAGSDVSAPTVALAMRMAARLGCSPPPGRETSLDHAQDHDLDHAQDHDRDHAQEHDRDHAQEPDRDHAQEPDRDHDRAQDHDHAGHRVRFAVADVRAGLPSSADTVTALHVLEHLAPPEFPVALRRLCAAARRRVVVAVPLEAVADPTYGHRTAIADLDALRQRAAEVTGWRADVHEHRGGWLVLDRLGVAQATGASRSRSRSRITPALVAPGSST